VIICYCLVKNTQGPLSVYNQHRQHFLSQDIDTCPCKLFMKQLTSKICQWQEEGNELIIGRDWNTNTALAQWLSQWASLGFYEPVKRAIQTMKHPTTEDAIKLMQSMYHHCSRNLNMSLRELMKVYVELTIAKSTILVIPTQALGIGGVSHQCPVA